MPEHVATDVHTARYAIYARHFADSLAKPYNFPGQFRRWQQCIFIRLCPSEHYPRNRATVQHQNTIPTRRQSAALNAHKLFQELACKKMST